MKWIISSARTLFECELYVSEMGLKITQHGVSCNECNHQGFNIYIILSRI